MLFETQMSLEYILFNEARQACQDIYHMISPYMWNLKKQIEQVEILKIANY